MINVVILTDVFLGMLEFFKTEKAATGHVM